MIDQETAASAGNRPVLLYAVAMAMVLVVFALAGDNGVVYVVSLLGVPLVSGVLAGAGYLRFWHAAVGCVAVVVLDVVFDEKRVEDAAFFAVLALMMVGIAALARWVTARVLRSRRARHT